MVQRGEETIGQRFANGRVLRKGLCQRAQLLQQRIAPLQRLLLLGIKQRVEKTVGEPFANGLILRKGLCEGAQLLQQRIAPLQRLLLDRKSVV